MSFEDKHPPRASTKDLYCGNFFGSVGLYSGHYGTGFPVNNLYISTFNKVPSIYKLDLKLKEGIIASLKEKDSPFSIYYEEIRTSSDEVYIRNLVAIVESSHKSTPIMMELVVADDVIPAKYRKISGKSDYSDRGLSYIAQFFFQVGDDISSVLEYVRKFDIKADVDKPKIHLVTSTNYGIETVEAPIKYISEDDVYKNYGAGFIPVHETIKNHLNKGGCSGLILLHGAPGTGKTSYIRSLIGLVDRPVIFIPPALVQNITTPDFIPFLMSNKNSLLIIEDAEKAVASRAAADTSASAVSNILNITDGILGDAVSVTILATFNTSRESIDPALLRKARLVAEWKFDALEIEDCNTLLQSIYPEKDYKVSSPTTLAELYTFEEKHMVSKKPTTSIGFNRK